MNTTINLPNFYKYIKEKNLLKTDLISIFKGLNQKFGMSSNFLKEKLVEMLPKTLKIDYTRFHLIEALKQINDYFKSGDLK